MSPQVLPITFFIEVPWQGRHFSLRNDFHFYVRDPDPRLHRSWPLCYDVLFTNHSIMIQTILILNLPHVTVLYRVQASSLPWSLTFTS